MSWYGTAQPQLVFPLPQITTTSLPAATVGTGYGGHILVTNVFGSTAFTVTGSTGNWLSINSGGFLSGTPTVADTETVTITVTDGRGMSATQSYSLTVNSAGSQLQVATTTLPNASVGIIYSAALAASGGSGSYAWNIDSSAPNKHLWLAVTRAGQLFGTPQYDNASQGNVPDTVVVRVTDTSNGQSATASIPITIINSGPLAIQTATTLPNAVNGGAYFYQLTAAGGAPPYFNWKITAQTGSNQKFINNNGWLWMVPTVNGTDTVTVTVTDCTNATSSAVTFSVTTTSTIQLGGIDLLNGVIRLPMARSGHKYRHQLLAASGGTGTGQVFSIVNGSLPAGLSMTSGGLITGTPTQSGNASCSLQCVDSGSNTAGPIPISLNVGAQNKGTRPAANTASGFFIDTTGQFCDPNGFRFIPRGMNQNHFDASNSPSIYNSAGANAARVFMFETIFRGTNPGQGNTMASYVNSIQSEHTNNARYALVACALIPGTAIGTNGSGGSGQGTSPLSMGTIAAWFCDNVAAYNAVLQNKAGINIANEYGPSGVALQNCYAAPWDGPVGVGTTWQMPVASVNVSTGVITLTSTAGSHPLTGAATIGYVYFAGGNINKAIAINTTSLSTSAPWTFTATTLSDVSGWTSGGTISGGAIGMMRAAGYTDPLHINAGAQFGQDIGTYTANGPAMTASDPLQNTVLAYHAYGQTVNYAARISNVSIGGSATLTLNSTGAHHPFNPTGIANLNSNDAHISVSGVVGVNGINGIIASPGTGGSSGAWTVPTNATTTGAYGGGGFVVIAIANGVNASQHPDMLGAKLAAMQVSGGGVWIEEFGPEAPGGASPTIMSYLEVVQACEANGIPYTYWASDDNFGGAGGVGTSDGNPTPFWYAVSGNAGPSGTTFVSNGIEVALNPRFGLHTLAAPASSYL